jgi:hypothetical protein
MTSSIRTGTRSALAAALLLAGALACSSKSSTPTLASDLQGDLEAAKSSSIELANEGARRTQVVSAEELTTVPAAGPDRAVTKVPRLAVHKAKVGSTPAPAPAPSSSPTVLAPTPEGPVLATDTLRPMGSRPTPSAPSATPSRRGGYKSVGDVIRDAPFPINP